MTEGRKEEDGEKKKKENVSAPGIARRVEMKQQKTKTKDEKTKDKTPFVVTDMRKPKCMLLIMRALKASADM